MRKMASSGSVFSARLRIERAAWRLLQPREDSSFSVSQERQTQEVGKVKNGQGIVFLLPGYCVWCL